MEKVVSSLPKGALCCGWNYCGLRLAVGHEDGSISIHDPPDPSSSSSFSCSSSWKAYDSRIKSVVWLPPNYGDAIASVCHDGTLSIWEEVQEDSEPLTWKRCATFEGNKGEILDHQFGVSSTSLKLVVAYSDGHVKVHELLDPLNLGKWQPQADFQNVIDSVSGFGKPSCVSASIAWNPRWGEASQTRFVLGFSADLPQFNSPKIWDFDEAHQRWLIVAELALPRESGERVHAVAWAPNIGRPYEVIAVATCKGVAIWNVGLEPDVDGNLSTEIVALLSGHDGEVWQLDWDVSGMALASTGADGVVRVWQSQFNGVWCERATLDCGAVGGSHQ